MRGERAKHERTVIIKNLFEPELFDREVHLLLEYQNDLREECAKCGTVRKVTVYDVSLHTLNQFFKPYIHTTVSAHSGIRKGSHKSPWLMRRKPISSYSWWTVAFSVSVSCQRKRGMEKRNTSKLILMATSRAQLMTLLTLFKTGSKSRRPPKANVWRSGRNIWRTRMQKRKLPRKINNQMGRKHREATRQPK